MKTVFRLTATLLLTFLTFSTAAAQNIRPFTADMITSPSAQAVRALTFLPEAIAGQDECSIEGMDIPVGQVFDPVAFTLFNDPNSTDDLTQVEAQVEASTTVALSDFQTTKGNVVASSSQGAQINVGTLAPGEEAIISFRMEAVAPGQATLTMSGTHASGTFGTITCTFNVVYLPITITGTKWNDQNGNGVQNLGEDGVGDVTIYADLNGNDEPDGDDVIATTGSNGSYELVIQPVEATTHVIVREIVPEGRTQTFPGGADGFYEDDIDHGTNVQNANFGNRVPQGFIEVDRYDQTSALVQVMGGPLGDVPQTLILTGPAEVNVFFDGPNEGDAEDDDNNGLDEVPTQLVQLNLQGNGFELRLNDNQESIGQIEELENNTPGTLDLDPFADGDADSFFDVFFEIELPDGTVLHNPQPFFIQATISSKPPFERYIHLVPANGGVELFTENNQPSGVFITRGEHNTGFLERDRFEQTAALVQLVGGPFGNQPQAFILTGSAEALVYFDGPIEGDAEDDDDNGRDEVETELIELDLTDGQVSLRLNPSELSPGQIEEQQNNNSGTLDLPPFGTGVADSFFDVFFEIEVPGGLVVRNEQALRIEAVIGEKPPKDRYIHIVPDTPLELVDANGNGTGIFIVKAEHNTGFVEVDRYDQTTALMQLVGGPLGDVPQVFIVSGSTEINVFFEGDEGDAEDDDDDGLDDVLTVMTELALTDGTVSVSLNPDQATAGEIEEKQNNNPGLLDLDPFAPGDANSFFDVFFQIALPGGLVVHNGVALRVESMIGEKPPFDKYVHLIPPGGPLELLDANGNPTGVFIIRAEHNTGFVERDRFPQTSALVQLQGGPVGPEPRAFILTGSAEAHVLFDGPVEGDADDDDNNGLDEVSTQLVELSLTDGTVGLSLNPDAVSPGQIEEKQNNNSGLLDLDPFAPGDANSFFDVFFEIDFPGAPPLRNREPLRLEAMIGEKPPKDRYIHVIPDEPIQLFDPDGNPTGVFIVKAEHNTGFVEVDEFEETAALIQLRVGNQIDTRVLRGPATVDVFFDQDEGEAGDDDDDGLDDVTTLLREMELTDGTVTLRVNPARSSFGEIEEQANNNPGLLDLDPFAPGDADSFFDVFFEIELASGQKVYNAEPLRIETTIREKPPFDRYFHVIPEEGPIELVDANGTPTGVEIVRASHNTGKSRLDSSRNQSRASLTLNEGTQSETIDLTGESKGFIVYPGPNEGDAQDVDGNGLDEVPTEMVQLDLRGINTFFGEIIMRIRQAFRPPFRRSLGWIEEQTNETPGRLDLPPFAPGDFRADSFFDIFVEIELIRPGKQGVEILHTEVPMRISSEITNDPPDDGTVFTSDDMVPLLDENGEATNLSVAGISYDPSVSIEVDQVGDEIPIDFVLEPNYPNPFNPVTMIPFGVPNQQHVRLEVFDILGRRVAMLVDAVMPAGTHQATWDAQGLPSGIYIIQMTAADAVLTQRATLMK